MNDEKYTVLINIPALNEEKTIGELLDRLSKVSVKNVVFLPLVVDDGSVDGTAEITKGKGACTISHQRNLGVGAAFRTGVKEAIRTDADILVNMDSDGQFDPAYIPDLIQPILRGEADFVTSSRFINGAVPQMSKMKLWGNKRVANLINSLTGQRISDVSCGFRAYSRKAFLNLNLIGNFTYTHETILLLAFKGFAIREVSVPVRGTREFGRSRVASNLWKYALHSLIIILRCYRDYKPFRTFGIPGLLMVLAGAALLCVFLLWTFIKGEWYPKVAAFAAAFSILSGLIFLLIAVIADMVTRLRVQMDNIMEYMDNKNKTEKKTWKDN